MKINGLPPQALKAAMIGGTREWGERASAFDHVRYSQPIVGRKGRRICPCCKRRSTHLGMANGIALSYGCEWRMTRWVKDPRFVLRQRAKQTQGGGDEDV